MRVSVLALCCAMLLPHLCAAGAEENLDPPQPVLDRLSRLASQDVRWLNGTIQTGFVNASNSRYFDHFEKISKTSGRVFLDTVKPEPGGKAIDQLKLSWHEFTSTSAEQSLISALYNGDTKVLSRKDQPMRFIAMLRETKAALPAGIQVPGFPKYNVHEEWVKDGVFYYTNADHNGVEKVTTSPTALNLNSPSLAVGVWFLRSGLKDFFAQGSWNRTSDGRWEIKRRVEHDPLEGPGFSRSKSMVLNEDGWPVRMVDVQESQKGWKTVIATDFSGWKQVGPYLFPEQMHYEGWVEVKGERVLLFQNFLFSDVMSAR